MLKSSHLSAGFIAVLVGYTSSVAIVLQAAQAVGASAEQQNSWLLVLGIGMGLSSLGFSLRYKQPILTAWSTPGAALLVTSGQDIGVSAAAGAFLFSAALMILSGMSGWFERVMSKLPVSLGAAMLAGVLLPFALNVLSSLETQPLLVGCMLIAWVVGHQLWPRYNIPLVLVIGVLISLTFGLFDPTQMSFKVASPVWVTPSFEWSTLLGVGLPLFMVTMASQNLPGIAALHGAGYRPPISPLITWTGITSALLAPFGGFALNLAAITAAICAGKESDEDPEQRYKSALVAGVLYILTGIFGATVVLLFALFPQELVLSIAGLALLGTIGSSLHNALAEPDSRNAALLTFLVTFSGFSAAGIGSPFWGLLAGALVMASSRLSPRNQ